MKNKLNTLLVLLCSLFIMGASQCTREAPNLSADIDSAQIISIKEEIDTENDRAILCPDQNPQACGFGGSYPKFTTVKCTTPSGPGSYTITESCAQPLKGIGYGYACVCVNDNSKSPVCVYQGSSDCEPLRSQENEESDGDANSISTL